MAGADKTAELERRCAAAGLHVEEVTEEFEDEDGYVHGQHYGWSISSASGRFLGAAHLQHSWDVDFALSTRFEEYIPLDGYEAMWSPAGVIEAELVGQSPIHPDDHALTRLLRELKAFQRGQDPSDVHVTVPGEVGGPIVSLRFASPELHFWRTTSPAVHLISSHTLIPCLRIEGAGPLGSQVEAAGVLERLGNAALLEVDVSADCPFRLRTHYPWGVRFAFGQEKPAATLRRPQRVPEKEPFGLYIHARAEPMNPAIRFLSYYQVLEYFFPRYSVLAEVQRLRGELAMAPAVAQLSDQDLALVVSRTTRTRGAGNELDQFKRTLEAIVAPDELRGLIEAGDGLRDFYLRDPALIVSARVPVEHQRDLRGAAATRLYKIRCRIVHRKEDSDEDTFIPFAPEVAELWRDNELIEFLARKAVLSAATTI